MKTDKKVDKFVLNGRMAFINIVIDGNDVTVIGLYDRRESFTNRFTDETIEMTEQLNIMEYLKDKLDLYSSYSSALVTIRYIISDKPITDPDTVIADIVSQLEGDIQIDHQSCYSELTGYLYTTQEMKVGGHDLLKELESHMKSEDYRWKWLTYDKCPEKYLWMEVVKHPKIENKGKRA